METEKLLDELFEIKSQIDRQFEAKRLAQEAVIPPEIKKRLEEIDAEFTVPRTVVERMDEITKQVSDEVIERAVTVKGKYLMAVYAKPRITWNTEALEGFVAAHPELLQFRKEGSPSVSIRKIGR